MNYGEAASAITIAVDVGHLFKKNFKGFDANILTWLPYDEDEDNVESTPNRVYPHSPKDQEQPRIPSCGNQSKVLW